jgi:hypothetical protein
VYDLNRSLFPLESNKLKLTITQNFLLCTRLIDPQSTLSTLPILRGRLETANCLCFLRRSKGNKLSTHWFACPSLSTSCSDDYHLSFLLNGSWPALHISVRWGKGKREQKKMHHVLVTAMVGALVPDTYCVPNCHHGTVLNLRAQRTGMCITSFGFLCSLDQYVATYCVFSVFFLPL